MAKTSFKQQMLQAREEAIVATANRFLAQQGFDLMTVDAIADEVGIAKASLYKHFPSKEALAAATMVKLMDRALDFLKTLATDAPPTGQQALTSLRKTVEWALRVQLAGEMPTLPSQNSSLRQTLIHHPPYLERLVAISDLLGTWILQAQQEGLINPALPSELVLYTVFSKACDPVAGVLKVSGNFSDDEIVRLLLQTCFAGLEPSASKP